jgi:DNA transformation protein and related proteins
VHDGAIYLKADPQNAAAFEGEQCPPFTYTAKGGKRGVMSYRRMPDRLYDDAEELAAWARDALAAARRGRVQNRPMAGRAGARPKKRR